MVGLKSILDTVKWDNTEDQILRSNCIESIGYIFLSVHDKPHLAKTDAVEICKALLNML
jgi:hypothetical protein